METLELFATCSTSLLSDALDALGLPEQYLGPGLRTVSPAPEARFLGPAKTITFRVRPREQWFPDVPRETMIAGLEKREKQVARGDVLVIACQEGAAPPFGILGDLGAATYKNLGVAGIVTNGFVRDVDEIAALGMPVVAAGTSPVNGRGRAGTSAMNEPVTINGVTIRTGDLVAADRDGVIVIPGDPELHARMRGWLDDAMSKENASKEMLRRGELLSVAFARHGQL
jgi:regulator of RNase E activity RraA